MSTLQPMHGNQSESASVAYLYDGSLEGLLTAVFKTYERHEIPEDITTHEHAQLRLGQDTFEVETDFSLANRVRVGLIAKAGEDSFEQVMRVSLSDDPAAPMAVLRFIRHVMAHERARYHALHDITHPNVEELIRIGRTVSRERHHNIEFMRFEELEGGLWYARCNPSANIVPLVMDWFVDRFNIQPFIIYDYKHEIAGVYDGQNPWYLVQSDAIQLPAQTAKEKEMQQAWRTFYETTANEARYNPELRRQLLPKRFWGNMPEFIPNLDAQNASAGGLDRVG